MRVPQAVKGNVRQLGGGSRIGELLAEVIGD